MQIAVQLLASLLLFILCAVIHGTGIVMMNRRFTIEEEAIRSRSLMRREFGLMVPIAVGLFLLHTLEILVFALFFLAAGASLNIEDAIFSSVSAYTTLGHSDPWLEQWRLVGGFEGLTGFLLIGWSAATFVTDMERVLRKKF